MSSSSSPIKESGTGVIYEGEARWKNEKGRKHKRDQNRGAIQEGHQDKKQDVTAVVEKEENLQKKKKKEKRGREEGNGADSLINEVINTEVGRENKVSSSKDSSGFVHEEEGSQVNRKKKKHKRNKDSGGIQEGHQGKKQDDAVLIEKEEDFQKKKNKRKHKHGTDAGANAGSNSVNVNKEIKEKGPSSVDSFGFIHEEEGSQEKKNNKKHKHDKDWGGIQEGHQDGNQYDVGEQDLGKKKKKRKHKHEKDCGSIQECYQDENRNNVRQEDLGERKKKRKHKRDMYTGEEVKQKRSPSSDNVMNHVDDSRKDKNKNKQIEKESVGAEAKHSEKSNGASGPEFVDSQKNDENGLESGNWDKKKKKEKKKEKAVKNGSESEARGNAKPKRVSFSGHVQVFPSSDGTSDADQCGREELVQGKRFSKEEDELIRNAVHNYIEGHGLGEEGLHKVLHCKKYPEVKNCWKEIGAALPWRPRVSVYARAHIMFERSEKRSWTPEECEFVRGHVEKHGPQWKALAEELGKHRFHVKDTWRRIKLINRKRGRWSQEEYQKLFDLVNQDLRLKASEEKKAKYGMLRDNICWGVISDKHSTRAFASCCLKWYNQLSSPMVAQGIWADSDDYRLLDALSKVDACCIEDVDWDNLLEHRSGDVCRARWDQMVRYIGHYAEKSFSEQVDILADRYLPDLLEARVAYENKPPVDVP